MVNEIDTHGHVVHLTSLQPLTPPEEKPPIGASAIANGQSDPATKEAGVDNLATNGVLHGQGRGFSHSQGISARMHGSTCIGRKTHTLISCSAKVD